MQPKPQWVFSPETLPVCLLWEFGLEHRECLEKMGRCGHGTHTGLTLSLVGRVFPSQSHSIDSDSGSASTSTALSLRLCSPCQDGTTSPGHTLFSIQHMCSMSRPLSLQITCCVWFQHISPGSLSFMGEGWFGHLSNAESTESHIPNDQS